MPKRAAPSSSITPLCSAVGQLTEFKSNDDASIMSEFYRRHQILLVRDVTPQSQSNAAARRASSSNQSPFDKLCTLWSNCPRTTKTAIGKNFTIENGHDGSSLTANAFFTKPLPDTSFYASCILQGDQQLSDAALDSLFPFGPSGQPAFMFPNAQHSQPIWCFVGRNTKKPNMLGRPEHTDCVSHSGTWHYQMSGSKVWLIRPAACDEWGSQLPQLSAKKSKPQSEPEPLKIECHEGDMLFINTRLWRHHTQIPCTNAVANKLSMSCARDFYCADVNTVNAPAFDEFTPGSMQFSGDDFTNIDAVFATKNVKKGAIVMRESEMPDCSLPRDPDANCEVAVLENEEGEEEYCLVARVNIKKGEYLAVLPSDDEDDSEDEDSDE